MKIHREGTLYEVENFDSKDKIGQMIQFIEKESVVNGSIDYNTIGLTKCDGTTTEELIKVLIHRLGVLNKKSYAEENVTSIKRLEEALFWQQKRTLNRKLRKIENKN